MDKFIYTYFFLIHWKYRKFGFHQKIYISYSLYILEDKSGSMIESGS